MSKVVQFPNRPSTAELVLKGIVEACKTAGLTEAQKLTVLKEFKRYAPKLLVSINTELRLPDGLGLTSVQQGALAKAHADMANVIAKQHSNQMSYVCTLVVELLIREQLNDADRSA